MKKSQTLALVIAALAVFSGFGFAQQGEKQKSPTTRPTPSVPEMATSVKSSKSNSSDRVAASPQVLTGKVTQVNASDKTFAVEASFSAGRLNGDYAFNVGETINVAYTQSPGGPMMATSVRSGKSNGDARMAAVPQMITGKVTQVNAREKIFAVAVEFSAVKLSTLPAPGQIVDVTYIKDPNNPNGKPLGANLNFSKSNVN